MNAAVIHRVRIHRLAIPMRVSVEHAAAKRRVSDPVVVEVEMAGGQRGFGETLARPYVTGEDADSVVQSITDRFVPEILNFRPASFPEALEFVESLSTCRNDGTTILAARAAVELALLDVAMRRFRRGVDDIVQWMGLVGFGRPGSLRTARYSGVLATEDCRAMMRRLRLMYWAGLRQFKIKVGAIGDVDRVRKAARYLAAPIAAGRASLRIDANGAWAAAMATEWLSAMRNVPIDAVEQPLARGEERELIVVRKATGVRFVHDESLLCGDDAKSLIELGVADFFNIRISKCGGFLPSLRLAALARKHKVGVQIGCMVGETSILSGAGLRLLQVIPEVQWVEGCFGGLLLCGDVVRKPLRFGFAGKPPHLQEDGWGINVEDGQLARWAQSEPKCINL